jgi:UDP-glucose 4-epimerase
MSANPTVLVTGALGVNGVWTLRELLDRGADVVASDLHPNFDLAPELAAEVEFAALDVTDLERVRAALAAHRPSAIVHLAAMLPGQAQKDPFRGFEVNVMATANLLQASREFGVERFVFSSSKGAYGEISGAHADPRYEPLKETDRTRPVTVYDHAKCACEGLGANYAETGGPDFTALRFATIYGPGKLERHGPMSQVSQLVEDAVAGRPTRIERGAEQRDDMLYVRDVGASLATAALSSRPFRNRIYNVGTGRAVSMAELADVVRATVPDTDIEIGPGLDPMGFGVSYYGVMDASLIRDDLGFEPAYPLEAGIADYAQRLGAAATEGSGGGR